MKRGNLELRLRLPRIEKKPKPAYLLKFQDFAKIAQRPDLQDELDEMIESIERGDVVPEAYYAETAGLEEERKAAMARRDAIAASIAAFKGSVKTK